MFGDAADEPEHFTVRISGLSASVTGDPTSAESVNAPRAPCCQSVAAL